MTAHRYALLALACLVSPGSARAEAPPAAGPVVAGAPHERWASMRVGGSIRSDYFSSDNALTDETHLLGLTSDIELSSAFGSSLAARLEARLTVPDVASAGSWSEAATLREGYVDVHLWRLDARVGKQSVVWGRADGVSPTDNLTPRDYLVVLPFEEDQRFGTAALALDAHLGPDHTLTLFTTAFFEPSRIPLPLPPGAVVVGDRIPPATLSNTEVGLRLNRTNGETDWSLSYFHGFSLIPEIGVAGVVPPASLGLELRYPRIDVIGGDVARTLGEYGLRAEVAYVAPRGQEAAVATVLQPFVFGVVGVDRTIAGDVNVSVQLVARVVPGFQDPEHIADPLERTIATKNAILFGQRHRTNPGLTARVSGRWLRQTLAAELLAVTYLDPANAYVRPLVSYAFTDRVKGSLGANLYLGPEDTFFGSLHANEGAFVETRYSF